MTDIIVTLTPLTRLGFILGGCLQKQREIIIL